MNPLPTTRAIASLAALAASLMLTATAGAQDAFPDVPPCHWAAEAVDRIGTPVEADAAQSRASRALAANAPRQVLEGLRCGQPEWSERFLSGPPADWPPDVAVRAFGLEISQLRRSGDEGEADLSLTITLDDGMTLERSGTVQLAFNEGEWRVSYASLAALDLPIFP